MGWKYLDPPECVGSYVDVVGQSVFLIGSIVVPYPLPWGYVAACAAYFG